MGCSVEATIERSPIHVQVRSVCAPPLHSECKEYLKDPDDAGKVTDETRDLGLVVCRGTTVTLICPTDGTQEIANPFMQAEA